LSQGKKPDAEQEWLVSRTLYGIVELKGRGYIARQFASCACDVSMAFKRTLKARAMTPLNLADPGPLTNIKPSVPECLDAWGTSFFIGRHIYGIRIETVPLANLGLECFFDEQGIDQPDNGLGYIAKFDNALNEVDEKSAYSRLHPNDRLTISEMRQLQALLGGGMLRFMTDHNPQSIIGIPNDSKLADWYVRLARRISLPTYRVETRGTAFHPHKVLLVRRR
jgi:hypothetical protein